MFSFIPLIFNTQLSLMHLIRSNVLELLFPTSEFTGAWHFSEYLNTLKKESVFIQCVFQ